MKTYTPSNSMICCVGNSGDYCAMKDYTNLRRKAHELAESVLMGWPNSVEIATKFVEEDFTKWNKEESE